MANRRQRRRSEKEHRHSPRSPTPPAPDVQLAARVERLAYTRQQAAKAIGVSLATLDRRVVPAIATVQTEWGARLIPVAELERYLVERRQAARVRQATRPGRKPGLPPELVTHIRRRHAKGESLGEIARQLNTEHVPTAQGGRQWWPSTVRAVLVRSAPPVAAPALE
ncbi:MAG: recombinase family protein [Gaiellaceae bacterium]